MPLQELTVEKTTTDKWSVPTGIPLPAGLDTVTVGSLSASSQDHWSHRPAWLPRPWFHAGSSGNRHGDLSDPCWWVGAQRAVPKPEHRLCSATLWTYAGLHSHCGWKHLLLCWTSGWAGCCCFTSCSGFMVTSGSMMRLALGVCVCSVCCSVCVVCMCVCV